ncbi:hypothetical protein RB195_002098 [Necator americanus]|uniref:Uncharacterized protein n=1 Tax=Necator americanus TaxID=51031 RepID=A0ABR1DHE1_NECAM
MHSQYPRQAHLHSVTKCRPSPRALITYEVVEAPQDEIMTTRLSSTSSAHNCSPVLESSMDSFDSVKTTPQINPQHRRPRRTRPRKAPVRQLVLDEEEMLKIPSPDMLNSMIRGTVELNGRFW